MRIEVYQKQEQTITKSETRKKNETQDLMKNKLYLTEKQRYESYQMVKINILGMHNVMHHII